MENLATHSFLFILTGNLWWYKYRLSFDMSEYVNGYNEGLNFFKDDPHDDQL